MIANVHDCIPLLQQACLFIKSPKIFNLLSPCPLSEAVEDGSVYRERREELTPKVQVFICGILSG